MSNFLIPKAHVTHTKFKKIIAVTLPEDLIEPFYEAIDGTDFSASKFIGHMIRHCLEDLKPNKEGEGK